MYVKAFINSKLQIIHWTKILIVKFIPNESITLKLIDDVNKKLYINIWITKVRSIKKMKERFPKWGYRQLKIWTCNSINTNNN